MAIDKKLIHFKTKENFMSANGVNGNPDTPSVGSEAEGNAEYGQIKGTSIVFIKDSNEIWTHGNLYKSVNWSELQVLDNPGVIYLGENTAIEKPTMGVTYLASYVFTYPVRSELKINFNISSSVLIIESGSKEGSALINIEKGLEVGSRVEVTISPSEDKFYRYSVTAS